MNAISALSAKKLKVGYAGRSLCKPLNLNLYEGELVCLVGPNGCGKSTLLRTLAGLQPALSGDISLNDKKLKSLSGRERARLVSCVLTDRSAAESLTVRQVVEMGRMPYTNMFGSLTPSDKEICEASINKMGLSALAGRSIAEISDGERQRCFIAKALAQDTPLILLDEPDSFLDLPNKTGMMRSLKSLAKDNQKAVLFSTHELELALQAADKLWLFRDETIERGTPEDLVLEEKIQLAFSNKDCRFDAFDGTFKICAEQKRPVGLINDGADELTEIWTKRALVRNGYYVSPSEELFTVTMNEKREWTLETPSSRKTKYHSLEDLIFNLGQ